MIKHIHFFLIVFCSLILFSPKIEAGNFNEGWKQVLPVQLNYLKQWSEISKLSYGPHSSLPIMRFIESVNNKDSGILVSRMNKRGKETIFQFLLWDKNNEGFKTQYPKNILSQKSQKQLAKDFRDTSPHNIRIVKSTLIILNHTLYILSFIQERGRTCLHLLISEGKYKLYGSSLIQLLKLNEKKDSLIGINLKIIPREKPKDTRKHKYRRTCYKCLTA